MDRPATEQDLDLTCYLHPAWAPLIRPAPAARPWMEATPYKFAYRCLPLNIANAHGWEVLTYHGFEAVWDGGAGVEAVTIRPDPNATAERLPVSLFGQGVLTFHVEGIIRTPPGWNIWISGSPNRQKDAIQPLSAVVETDWAPFTFTMNWRFTRTHAPIRFEAMEPFCFFFPVRRSAIETFKPAFVPLGDDPALTKRFHDWSRARDEFQAEVRRNPPATPGDHWQKHYYRGVDVEGEALIDDHRSKLRLRGFDASAAPNIVKPPPNDPPERASNAGRPSENVQLALAKREWLLEALQRQHGLAPAAACVERRADLGGDEFLERYYAANRPVILTGELAEWPALARWSPAYLKARVGSRPIEYQGGRAVDPHFEIEREAHRREAPFDLFIDAISHEAARNDSYITAFNSERNRDALAVLHEDMGRLDKLLDSRATNPNGMMWIGPAGTFTPLHHDLTNNLLAQIVGRKRVKLLPAAEVGKLYNFRHVYSEITDLEVASLDLDQHPRLAQLRSYDVLLEPGEVLFIPLAWWHQVKSLDFSVTATYTNFRWPNDAHATYPAG